MLEEAIDAAYAERYSPWGRIYDVPSRRAANDNLPLNRPQMIGLTGRRNVGKSTVARLLEKEFNFVPVHPYGGGKVAAVAFFDYITCNAELAWRMVYGDLKDVPSDYLPGNVSPRYFMEKDGHFRGSVLGLEWTLGLEIDIARREHPGRRLVVESLVYEADWFRAKGGMVVRLERPDHDGPAGVESDRAQAGVRADACISARGVDDLEREARKLVQQVYGGG